MGHREILKCGDEFDCVRARHCYKYLARCSHKIKKRMSRRARRLECRFSA